MTDLLQVILDIRNGAVACDVNQKFNEMVKAVLDTGGKGEMTIKLFVKPSKMAIGGAVIETEVSHECKTKKPELPVGGGFFFVTKDGDLTRDDPAQAAMFELEQQESKEKK